MLPLVWQERWPLEHCTPVRVRGKTSVRCWVNMVSHPTCVCSFGPRRPGAFRRYEGRRKAEKLSPRVACGIRRVPPLPPGLEGRPRAPTRSLGGCEQPEPPAVQRAPGFLVRWRSRSPCRLIAALLFGKNNSHRAAASLCGWRTFCPGFVLSQQVCGPGG